MDIDWYMRRRIAEELKFILVMWFVGNILVTLPMTLNMLMDSSFSMGKFLVLIFSTFIASLVLSRVI